MFITTQLRRALIKEMVIEMYYVVLVILIINAYL